MISEVIALTHVGQIENPDQCCKSELRRKKKYKKYMRSNIYRMSNIYGMRQAWRQCFCFRKVVGQ